MAKSDDQQLDLNEEVRRRLKAFLTSLWIIVPSAILVYALYKVVLTPEPAREAMETPEHERGRRLAVTRPPSLSCTWLISALLINWKNPER